MQQSGRQANGAVHSAHTCGLGGEGSVALPLVKRGSLPPRSLAALRPPPNMSLIAPAVRLAWPASCLPLPTTDLAALKRPIAVCWLAESRKAESECWERMRCQDIPSVGCTSYCRAQRRRHQLVVPAAFPFSQTEKPDACRPWQGRGHRRRHASCGAPSPIRCVSTPDCGRLGVLLMHYQAVFV